MLQCNRAGCAGSVDWYTGRQGQDLCVHGWLAKVIVKRHYSEVQVGDGFRPETGPGAEYP